MFGTITFFWYDKYISQYEGSDTMKETYEKAILVGCQREEMDDERFQSSMDELESLTETAGGEALVAVSLFVPSFFIKSLEPLGKFF